MYLLPDENQAPRKCARDWRPEAEFTIAMIVCLAFATLIALALYGGALECGWLR
jgi:hypothetical protein